MHSQENLQGEEIEVPVRIYNLTVKENHTFYVAEIKILAHNQAKANGDMNNSLNKYGGLKNEGRNTKMNKAIFKDKTLEYRSHGLPNNLIVVENCDEWLYCIDVDTEKVVSWHRINGVLGERYHTFLDFIK